MPGQAEHRAGTVLAGQSGWEALLFLFLALGVAMIILDATVVNVALPTMITDLGLTTNEALLLVPWVRSGGLSAG